MRSRDLIALPGSSLIARKPLSSSETLLASAGRRVEALKGDRKGQYSIRINHQWRICFDWPTGSPAAANVEIINYHQKNSKSWT